MILIGALMFAEFINITTMPNDLVAFVKRFEVHPVAVVAAICIIYVLLGTAMEELSMVLLTLLTGLVAVYAVSQVEAIDRALAERLQAQHDAALAPVDGVEDPALAAHVVHVFDGTFRQVLRLRIAWTLAQGGALFPEAVDLWNRVR